MSHLSGKKVSKSHSTVINAAAALLRELRDSPLVDKVSVGQIKVIGNGPRRIKLATAPAGMKLVVRGRNEVQSFFIYTSRHEAVDTLINRLWSRIGL